MEGTVKWFNKGKGYGFVQGEDGQDYFVHQSALQPGMFLNENDKVEFDAAETERGKQAQNIRLKTGEAEPAEEKPAEPEEPAPEEPAPEEPAPEKSE